MYNCDYARCCGIARWKFTFQLPHQKGPEVRRICDECRAVAEDWLTNHIAGATFAVVTLSLARRDPPRFRLKGSSKRRGEGAARRVG